jgi:hypothetical protein
MLQRKQTPRPSILGINITAVIKYGNGSNILRSEQISRRIKHSHDFAIRSWPHTDVPKSVLENRRNRPK